MVSSRMDDQAVGPEVQADILVVDDDRDLADFLGRRALDYFDKPVLLAGSLEEANAAIDDHRPKIVLVDMLLPDGEGTELLLRLEREGVPAYAAITGAPDVARATVALHTGAAAFIPKPFTDEQLDAAFERLARRLADHESADRLRRRADETDKINQELRGKIDILCKDLVSGYQKLVARVVGP